ncbi:MAG: helix-turn-helix transcriptional regulator [Sphingomonas sp.]
MATHIESVGDLLRDWRARRRLSQLELAGDAGVSTRHLSFVESGRSVPSRDMLLRLAEPLAMPLRTRNRLLLAGGYAPLHGERTLDQPDMASAKAAVEAILAGHVPFPALAIDRHWNLVAANEAVAALLDGVDPALLQPPVNILRLSLAPGGLAPRILNLAEWRHHLLARLRDEADRSGDSTLLALHRELSALPFDRSRTPPGRANAVAIPLTLLDTDGKTTLSFLSATTVFGTATDITLAELTLECFYPADAATRATLMARWKPQDDE